MTARALAIATAALVVSPAIAVGAQRSTGGVLALIVTTAVVAGAMRGLRGRAWSEAAAGIVALAAAAITSVAWGRGAAAARPTFEAVVYQLGTGLFPAVAMLPLAIGEAARDGDRTLRLLVAATIGGMTGWAIANTKYAVAPLPVHAVAAAAIGLWLDAALRDDEPRPLAALVAGGSVYLVARDLTHDSIELGVVAKRGGLVIAAAVMAGLGARSRRVRYVAFAVAWIAAAIVAAYTAVSTVPDAERARAEPKRGPDNDALRTALSPTPPRYTQPSSADWEGMIDLVGLTAPREVHPGDTATIELVFRAKKPLPPDHVVGVRLFGCDEMVGTAEGVPVDGAHPTQGWRVGEFVRHTVRIDVDREAPPCHYEVIVGWRHKKSREERLLVTFGTVRQSMRGDALVGHILVR